jgi:hypothetical protein
MWYVLVRNLLRKARLFLEDSSSRLIAAVVVVCWLFMVACFECMLLLQMCCMCVETGKFLISLWTFDFYEVAIGKAPLRKKIARARAGTPSRNFPVVHPVLALCMSYPTYLPVSNRCLGSSFRRHSMELSCSLPEPQSPTSTRNCTFSVLM